MEKSKQIIGKSPIDGCNIYNKDVYLYNDILYMIDYDDKSFMYMGYPFDLGKTVNTLILVHNGLYIGNKIDDPELETKYKRICVVCGKPFYSIDNYEKCPGCICYKNNTDCGILSF